MWKRMRRASEQSKKDRSKPEIVEGGKGRSAEEEARRISRSNI